MGEAGQGLALAIPTAGALQFWQMAERALSRGGSPPNGQVEHSRRG